MATLQIPQGSKTKDKISKSKLAPENWGMGIPPKQQRCKSNQSELNNQIHHHYLYIPSQPELTKDMARNGDSGYSEPTIIQTFARKRQIIECLV